MVESIDGKRVSYSQVRTIALAHSTRIDLRDHFTVADGLGVYWNDQLGSRKDFGTAGADAAIVAVVGRTKLGCESHRG